MSQQGECCAVCSRGKLEQTRITWFDRLGDPPAMVVNVPARVCAFCGDQVIAASVARMLDRLAEERPPPARTVELPVYDLADVNAPIPA